MLRTRKAHRASVAALSTASCLCCLGAWAASAGRAPHTSPAHASAPPALGAPQCTGANPRYPRIAELKQLLIDAWERPIAETLTTEPGLGATAVPLT